MLPVYTWVCPVEVGMPLRGRKVGRITASRASMMTAEIANDALSILWASRARHGAVRARRFASSTWE